MSTYRNKSCPYCKKTISTFERSEFFYYNRYIGLKYEKCPFCNKIYSTNKKLYFEMNQHEKNKLFYCYLLNIFSSFCTLYAILFLILLFSLNFSPLATFLENIIQYIMILPIIPCSILGYFLAKRDYDDIKNLKYEDFKIDNELLKINKFGG